MTRAVKFELLKVGHCSHPECIAMRGGKFKATQFPALVGLIKHPEFGYLLYDTGYSKHFMAATRSFPECLYRWVTPPSLRVEEELLFQLAERNISADEISGIIISHFHGDHVAGLKDFPNAKFVATKEEFDEVTQKGRLSRLHSAFLADLIPDDFADRVTYAEDLETIGTDLERFEKGYDLVGDGSLIGIALPGHTRSQLGLYFTDDSSNRIFLIGDACWKIEALKSRSLPSRVTNILFADRQAYAETFLKIADLHAIDVTLTIIPSHCVTTWQRLGNNRLDRDV